MGHRHGKVFNKGTGKTATKQRFGYLKTPSG